jgi:hypothetical protein
MVPTMVDLPRVAARKPRPIPRINWMEIAAGWALAFTLQLALLFLGFGLGVGAIDFKAAGEELRQQVLSVLAADRASSLAPMRVLDGRRASEPPAAIGAAGNRSIGSSRVASVLPDEAGMARRAEAGSMASDILHHAGPVVFWLAVWGMITWIASMFHPAPQSS